MEKKLRVLIIDSEKKTITEGSVATLSDMQAIVDGYIECGCILPSGDRVYVDEDGISKAKNGHFYAFGQPQLLHGNGFIIGKADKNGDETDAVTTLAQAHKWIAMMPGGFR